jgi:hypothetical protein
MLQLPHYVEHSAVVRLGVVLAIVILETSPHLLMFQANAFVRVTLTSIQTSPASDSGQPTTEDATVFISTVLQM